MSRWLVAVALSFPLAALATEGEASAKIRDNLFLLEEAYNQEPGVIQHIQTLQLMGGGWQYSFTEEWPAPTDLHQLSITVPMQRSSAPTRFAEVGDLMINYRLQAMGVGGQGLISFAPRLSLVFPTGNVETGAGRGSLGLQANLPVSLDLHESFVLHLNAGGTWVPNAHSAAGTYGTAFDTAVGAAFVWLPLHAVNAVLEVAHFSTSGFDAGGRLARTSSFVVNPAVRFAIDFPSGLQVVPGLAFPIELGRGAPAFSVFTYLSLEHPLWR